MRLTSSDVTPWHHTQPLITHLICTHAVCVPAPGKMRFVWNQPAGHHKNWTPSVGIGEPLKQNVYTHWNLPFKGKKVLPTSLAPEMFGFCEALGVAVGPVHLHSFCGNRQDLWLPSFLHRPCSWTQHSWMPTSTLAMCSKRPGYSTGLWQPT